MGVIPTSVLFRYSLSLPRSRKRCCLLLLMSPQVMQNGRLCFPAKYGTNKKEARPRLRVLQETKECCWRCASKSNPPNQNDALKHYNCWEAFVLIIVFCPTHPLLDSEMPCFGQWLHSIQHETVIQYKTIILMTPNANGQPSIVYVH